MPSKIDPYHDYSDYSVPCQCIKNLRLYLEEHGLSVYSEYGEPHGWVNVTCEKKGHYTYEGMLRKVEEEEDE